MSQIQIKCSGTLNVSLDNLIDIQGDLKNITDENLDKLLGTMRENGFCEPFVVWKDEEKKLVVISGNQRLKALKKARELNWTLPSSFPAVEVKAESYKEAKKMLLSLASYYGRADKLKLEEFILSNDFDLKETISLIEFPDITFKLEDNPKEQLESADGSLEYISFPFFREDYIEAKELWDNCFNLLFQNDGEIQTTTDAFLFILKYFYERNKPKT